jgi:hypothetical protein
MVINKLKKNFIQFVLICFCFLFLVFIYLEAYASPTTQWKI